MADETALRDANRVFTLLAIDDTTGEIVNLRTDADGNLLIAATISDLDVAGGGTGRTSFTAYAVITGGTTSTGALQQVSGLGSAGTVLTSNGPAALPSWQAAASGTVTTVSVTTANGVSGSVANPTTTPAITLTLGDITPSKVNGLTISTTTGTLTLTNAKTLAVTHTLTLSGTDGTVMTFPTTSATLARIDAANTFLGVSTASGWVMTSLNVSTVLRPTADDGTTLGDVTHNFSDLFLATGAVINFANGNVVLTHSSGILTLTTGTLALGANNLTMTGSIAATGARVTKGWFTDIESTNAPTAGGVAIPTISSTNTLTNKRVTRRLTTTNAPGGTPTTNTDNVDIMNFTGLAADITSMTTNLSGTPVDGDIIEFRFTDNGTARGITWGASFAATTVALPTTTVISTMLRVLFEFQGTTWKCLATA